MYIQLPVLLTRIKYFNNFTKVKVPKSKKFKKHNILNKTLHSENYKFLIHSEFSKMFLFKNQKYE